MSRMCLESKHVRHCALSFSYNKPHEFPVKSAWHTITSPLTGKQRKLKSWSKCITRSFFHLTPNLSTWRYKTIRLIQVRTRMGKIQITVTEVPGCVQDFSNFVFQVLLVCKIFRSFPVPCCSRPGVFFPGWTVFIGYWWQYNCARAEKYTKAKLICLTPFQTRKKNTELYSGQTDPL